MIEYKNKYYITPSELAKLRGVSIQYIYKLLSTKLNNFSTKVENKRMIDISVFPDYFNIEIPTELLNQIQPDMQSDSTRNQPEEPFEKKEEPKEEPFEKKNEDNEIVKLLNQQIEYLKSIIDEKDRQIHTLHSLLKASEELQRNHQILLLQSTQKNNTGDSTASEIHSDDNNDNNTENPVSNESKKGFFRRLFG